MNSFSSLVLRFALCALPGLAGLTGAASAATGDLDVSYEVSRGDRRIGHYRFTIEDHNGRREVALDMSITVKLLFVTVYRARQHRRDVWEEGRLLRSEGESVYNGTTTRSELTRTDGRSLWTVNRVTRTLMDPSIITFVPWRPIAPGRITILGDRGRADPAELVYAGRETIEVASRRIEADKYELTGRKRQKLWYDPQGILVWAQYESRGSIIDVKLEPDAQRADSD